MGAGTTGRRRRLLRIIAAVGAVLMSVVAAAVLDSKAEDSDPLAVFCREAAAEQDAFVGDNAERVAALDRLVSVAPQELARLVNDAAAPAGELPKDLFVVPGDANSAVRADVAAEVFGQQSTRTQAVDRLERVLVGECGIRLDGSEGERGS